MEHNDCNQYDPASASADYPMASSSKLPDKFMEKFINDKADKLRRTVSGDEEPVANPNSPIDIFIQMSTDENPEV